MKLTIVWTDDSKGVYEIQSRKIIMKALLTYKKSVSETNTVTKILLELIE